MNATDLDLSLVRRAQSGERQAFDLLVRKYQDRINRLARRYMGNPADAQDVTQDIFIKAYRGLGLFRCESAFYTWLYRLAINSAKNALLARAREPAGHPLDSSSEDEFPDVWSAADFAFFHVVAHIPFAAIGVQRDVRPFQCPTVASGS
jgi:RNA polymerase sigma-70 factor, ECF subfamily